MASVYCIVYVQMSTCVIQYKFSEAELSSRTLWLSVWDWDRFGRNQFLGEIRLPLSSLDLTDSTDHWHTLLDKVWGMYMYTLYLT
jgi:hypothetical protein